MKKSSDEMKKNIVLEANGPRILDISVFETIANIVTKNNLVGFSELDLSEIFNPDMDHSMETHDLFDPHSKSKVVGKITLGYSAEDYDESGELSSNEFCDLIRAFGNRVSDKELETSFAKADQNKDGKVSAWINAPELDCKFLGRMYCLWQSA